LNVTPIRDVLSLRDVVALEDEYSIFERNMDNLGTLMFVPITGTLSQGFDPKGKHFAVDIVAPKDSPVKSIADGTVIFAEWTSQTGYVIIVDHQEAFISEYKHTCPNRKPQRDIVLAVE